MEVDNEVSGNGNSYTTEFRQYDPRLGRWKSLDPLMRMFPSMSPYCAFDNNPVYYVDPYGLSASTNGEPEKVIHREGSVTGGDRKNRDEILRNMEKVADGTIVKFVYADGEATYTYTIGNDGSGRGLWMGRWEKPADAGEEFDVVGDAGTLRTPGSKMNLGGEVPQLAKAEPSNPELNNGGIDIGSPDAVNDQAGQEVKTDGLNNKPTIGDTNADDIDNNDNDSQEIGVFGKNLKPGQTRYTTARINWNDAEWSMAGGTDFKRLDKIAEILQNNPKLTLTIVGNIATGTTSDPSWDNPSATPGVTIGQLADYRTIVLYNYLINKGGIDSSQLKRKRGKINETKNATGLNIKYNK